ncbi:MAG TPA: MarR family transcriptional regulator [Anaerolineae bacterium]|nr:MarR family transcriptional regulator [Anaerolineae bacterium]HMR67731.1 MarR family transcriptional regulator [Anaerolineae bacterium]
MGTHYKGSAQEIRALDAYIKLYRAAEAVSTRINRHLQDVNLTVSQFGVLEALYHLGPLHQNELAEKILKSGGNMTLVIDNLVKRDLVERVRDQEDRRFVTVHLTETGRDLIRRIFPRHVSIVVRAFSGLTLDEQAQLESLCRKVGLNDEQATSE